MHRLMVKSGQMIIGKKVSSYERIFLEVVNVGWKNNIYWRSWQWDIFQYSIVYMFILAQLQGSHKDMLIICKDSGSTVVTYIMHPCIWHTGWGMMTPQPVIQFLLGSMTCYQRSNLKNENDAVCELIYIYQDKYL